MLPSCVPAAAPAAELDAAVADIELLKARVQAMGHRSSRYSHVGGFGPVPGDDEQPHQQAMATAATSDGFAMLRYAAENLSNHVDLVTLINRKGAHPLGEEKGHGNEEMEAKELEVEQREEVRKEVEPEKVEEEQRGQVRNGVNAMQEIGEAVSKKEIEEVVAPHSNSSMASQLQVISVLGTRKDLGTMLIKEAYDDSETCSNFTCRAWVKMMHPFNPCEFIRSLVAQFYPQEALEMMLATHALVIDEAEFKKMSTHRYIEKMSTHRYIVVLEDVYTMADWEAVRIYLPDKNNGSCIVVHTQQIGIASFCVGHPHQVSELKNLSADHSAYVFFNQVVAGYFKETVATDTKTAPKRWLDKNRLIWCGDTSFFLELCCVSSVWGVSGVGKSSLVKIGYYQRQVDDCYPGHSFGWVDVSHPFNLMDLSRSLLLDLDPG